MPEISAFTQARDFLIFFPFSYICFKNKLNIPIFVTGILSGLVSITGNQLTKHFRYYNSCDITSEGDEKLSNNVIFPSFAN